VWHYKTHSRRIKKTKKEVSKKEGGGVASTNSSLPDIRVTIQDPPDNHYHHHHNRLRPGEADETRMMKSFVDDDQDLDDSKRKVRINKQVDVRRVSSKKH